MRTTLTLDPDLAQILADEASRRRLPFKRVVNEAIRRGLAAGSRSDLRDPIRLTPHTTTLCGGIDPAGLNSLADELDEEARLKSLHQRS